MSTQTAASDSIPNAAWNGAALSEAWCMTPEGPARVAIGDLMADRLNELTSREPKTVFAIRTERGFWGKGATLQSAAHHAIKVGARKTESCLMTAVVNGDVQVLSDGSIEWDAKAMRVNLGTARVGGLL